MDKYKYPKPFILPKFFLNDGIMVSHLEMYLCHSCFFFLPLYHKAIGAVEEGGALLTLKCGLCGINFFSMYVLALWNWCKIRNLNQNVLYF